MLTPTEPSIIVAPFKPQIFLSPKFILQKLICLYAARKLKRTKERGTANSKHKTTVQETFPNSQSSLKAAGKQFLALSLPPISNNV